ncbi:MAG: tetratricopeptide repeat protein [Planctomycetaceae bacterium]|nr:tetratricopeptide repeat protein [Planctomycetaceae bacterium]
MNTFKHFGSCSFAAMVILLSVAQVTAQSPVSIRQTATEINAANTLLRDGKVDEALDAYRRIVPVEQQRDELNYNMAVAEYRKGNIEAAEALFTDIVGTDSPNLAADSRYNLGNCQYAGALQAAEQDKPAAIKLLRKAIANYRGALRGKPDHADARANIELAGELIRTLEQEQKKEEEQKKQDKQQQQDADKQQDQQNKDQQKQDESRNSESQDSESQKDESQKDSDQPKSDSQDSESDQEKSDQQQQQDEQTAADQPQEDPQKNDNQKSDQTGDEQQKSDQQNPSEQQSPPKNSDSSQKPQQSTGEQQPDDEGTAEESAAQHEPVPTGDLKAASEQEQEKKSEAAAGTAEQNGKDGLMTREEALKMLQAVRDRDMLRRMQQQRQERSRRVRVDKDW